MKVGWKVAQMVVLLGKLKVELMVQQTEIQLAV
jgi:hypothetical protein